ncbi:RNA ligase [Sulfitobacter sp. R18_1]|uniref:RNA ligase n=1 Tax=Sulfitobacter sp. R18_1 TaxID=2821104 RepID=UPI001ADA7A95|nr:RNA ligase [Sulfitobacter sp. R18_1]MBO9428358.1 hypothetical protein [Sulfitobacter sp. R18_1]
MNYEFPRIETLEDVLPAIEGVDGINCREVGHLTCLQYAILDPKLFDMTDDPELAALRRECRGLMFDTESGRLLSRPPHKFFNIGERDETRVENIRWQDLERAYPKLDGSMVRPIVFDDRLVMMTKRGYSDAAHLATDHLYKEYSSREISEIQEACENGLTPVYEFTGDDNQVVVKYGDPELTLLAVRDTYSGNYLDEQEIGLAGPKPVEIYEAWDHFEGDIADKLEQLRARTNEEGAVFRMRNGHMLKAKNTWYGRLHAVISNIDLPQSKRHIAALIINEQIDDVKSQTVGRKRDYLDSFEGDFWAAFTGKLEHLTALWKQGKEVCGDDRKKFATEYAPTIEDKQDRSLVLSSKNEDEIRERMFRLLMRQSESMTRWEEAEAWLAK